MLQSPARGGLTNRVLVPGPGETWVCALAVWVLVGWNIPDACLFQRQHTPTRCLSSAMRAGCRTPSHPEVARTVGAIHDASFPVPVKAPLAFPDGRLVELARHLLLHLRACPPMLK